MHISSTLILTTVVIAVASPYMWTSPPARLDEILILIVAALALARRFVPSPRSYVMALALVSIALWGTAGSIFIGREGTVPLSLSDFYFGTVSAFILASATVYAASWMHSRFGYRDDLYLSCLSKAITLLLVISTLMVVAQLSGYDMRPFWSGDQETTVGELSQSNGRFTGLFNQPVEVGMVSGLGLFIGLFYSRRGYWAFLSGAIATSTGFLSGSKVFYAMAFFGFAALALSVIGRTSPTSFRIWSLAGIACALVPLTYSGILGERIQRVNVFADPASVSVLTPSQGDGSSVLNPIAIATAGRLHPEGSLVKSIQAADIAPLTGRALDSPLVSFDSAWVEVYWTAGLFGVGAFAATLILYWLGVRCKEYSIWVLLMAGVSISTLGFNPLTANRAGLITILCLAPLLALRRQSERKIGAV